MVCFGGALRGKLPHPYQIATVWIFSLTLSVSLDETPGVDTSTPSEGLGKSYANRVWNRSKTHFGELQCMLKKESSHINVLYHILNTVLGPLPRLSLNVFYEFDFFFIRKITKPLSYQRRKRRTTWAPCHSFRGHLGGRKNGGL